MKISNDIKKILINENDLNQRINELAVSLTAEYNDKNPIILSLLKGSVPFTSELSKRLDFPLEFDYMKPSSYVGTKSSGEVQIQIKPTLDLKNRHVLVVEDIIDTGRTLYKVKELLKTVYQVKSVKIVALLDKKEMRVCDINPDFTGFLIPNEFVVGFGLDYNEQYRNLPYIGVLKEEIYQK